MNRLVLIGNGFDLAHGLPTRYEDFIHWYWDKRVEQLSKEVTNVLKDPLCTISAPEGVMWAAIVSNHVSFNSRQNTSADIIKNISNNRDCEITYVPFFRNILKSVAEKGWVDIENEYYNLLKKYALPSTPNPYLEPVSQLNEQLLYLQKELIKYLREVEQQNMGIIQGIKNAIYAPINPTDISVSDAKCFMEHIEKWSRYSVGELEHRIDSYGLDSSRMLQDVGAFRREYAGTQPNFLFQYPEAFRLPDSIMFLNFNYTSTAHQYLANHNNCFDNHIHGDIRELDKQDIIFGYGDELDADFMRLQNLNDNECLRNVKSIRYLESSNYRNALAFIESGPFQVCIMGHSCGNSDRTLLNTIFEHDNCVSIKPYYYVKPDGADNYIDIIQNISRNFNNRKLMRDRVVNKTLCEPLPQRSHLYKL